MGSAYNIVLNLLDSGLICGRTAVAVLGAWSMLGCVASAANLYVCTNAFANGVCVCFAEL